MKQRMCGMMTMVGLALVLLMGNAGICTAAGLLVADGGFGGRLAIQEHSVNVTINNGVAVTEVTQVFKNLEKRQVEALYTFPVPKQASVSNFSMWIGGKEMIGEVVEKQRAREIYESYKQTRRDPGLLEQKDYKTFEMRIFPIGPEAEQRVQITYCQELDTDHDWATYVYPLATSGDGGTDSRVEGKFGLNLQVKSEVPITKMESPSHKDDFIIVNHRDDYYQASLEGESGDLNRDLVLAYQVKRPVTGLDMICSRHDGEDGYFCMTLTAGEELEGKVAGMDYVFVLDISGSMANDGKLSMSRNSIDAFVQALSPEDRFEIITFNISPTNLFNELAPVNDENMNRAVQFLEAQRAKGGTVLNSAMTTAYKYGDPDRPLNVVVLSDGMTEQRESSDLLRIIQQKPSNAKVFCVGVGNEVNRRLLSQIAEEAGGIAAFISEGDDFERQAQAFRRKLTHPVATGLVLDMGNAVYDVEPQKLPNLYHGSPVRIYGRYKKSGPVPVNMKAEIFGAAFQETFEIEFPERDDQNPEIERMWAWHRVQNLLKKAEAEGSRSGVTDEIVRLGEGYSIATEYTSFLVLENDAEYKRWNIERKNELRVKRDRQKRESLRVQLEKLRGEALADMGPKKEDQIAKAMDSVIAPAAQDTQARQQNRNSVPSANSPQPQRESRGVDFGIPVGGGAIDPLSGAALVGLISLLGWSKRRSCR